MNFEIYNFVDLLATADGRASIRHWWAALISYALGVFLITLLTQQSDSALIGIFCFLLGLACVGGYFIISIKRLHDQNKSGTWVLINFIPGVGPVILLILLGFVPGDKEKNAYGKPFYLRKRTPDRSISDQYNPPA
ncbi:MAG: DUF805 domain-containing protein [Arenimonas sp.]